MESRFEYLNISHTPCCLFVLGIFEIKKNITQTKILFNLVKAYVRLQQTYTTFSFPEGFNYTHFFVGTVHITLPV